MSLKVPAGCDRHRVRAHADRGKCPSRKSPRPGAARSSTMMRNARGVRSTRITGMSRSSREHFLHRIGTAGVPQPGETRRCETTCRGSAGGSRAAPALAPLLRRAHGLASRRASSSQRGRPALGAGPTAGPRGGNGGRHREQEARHLGAVDAKRGIERLSVEAAGLQIGREKCPLDERQVTAFGILLALRHHQLGVGQWTNDRAHLKPEFGRGMAAAVAVGDLVAARWSRMRAHQDAAACCPASRMLSTSRR